MNEKDAKRIVALSKALWALGELQGISALANKIYCDAHGILGDHFNCGLVRKAYEKLGLDYFTEA